MKTNPIKNIANSLREADVFLDCCIGRRCKPCRRKDNIRREMIRFLQNNLPW